MNIYAETDVGMVRQMNQDAYYISEENDNYKLCILADGMGGYTGGEIASRLACVSAADYIKKNFEDGKPYTKEELMQIVSDAMQQANAIVYEKSREEKELEQMGTTLEICLIYNNRVFIGHIGDSRIYRIRQGIMRKITVDHSYVQKLVKDGTITKEEAIHHPKKNMLMKALGCEEKIEPDIMVKGFNSNDIILICSDGLTNMIAEQEIYNIIVENIETATQNLIKKAKELGGYDNITVIIIKN
jgi:serine/threonine protein phosphatase PrpC